MSQKYYEIAKRNYEQGLWNRAMIDHLLEIGRITQAEYEAIIGE